MKNITAQNLVVGMVYGRSRPFPRLVVSVDEVYDDRVQVTYLRCCGQFFTFTYEKDAEVLEFDGGDGELE